jgi:CRISPR-associated protein (TIGR03985 family)
MLPNFSDPPTIELLQWLARGSLRQNLSRAIRLWVWLQFLYGEELDESTPLSDPFTYADWRDAFFIASHPIGESVPPPHDRACRCTLSTADWLFSNGMARSPWQRSLQQHAAQPEDLEEILQSRLFGVTRRTLYADLQILCKLGWVQRQGHQYHRVKTYPARALATKTNASNVISHPDLAAIAENLSQQISGHQRFFLHVEYVVPKAAIDQVDEWQSTLRHLWEQTPVPPVRLTYFSAKLNQVLQRIVYPTCIYYAQRAPYLCAWGQPQPTEPIGWRNYRLDHIKTLEPIAWTDPQVPLPLHQAFQGQLLPTPDYIQEQLATAWGFDFYQPEALLVLRFDRDFSNRYIQGTVRHETFEPVTYAQVKALIQHYTPDGVQRQVLLQVWQERSPQDAYYRAHYRVGDPNVLLRLRAWRPRMEVLLPWDLRQQMAEEVERERRLYWERNSGGG